MAKKYVSAFVKRMRALTSIAKARKVLWSSLDRGTYIKSKHGKLGV